MKISKRRTKTIVIIISSILIAVGVFLYTSPSGFSIYIPYLNPTQETIVLRRPDPTGVTKIPPTAIKIEKLGKNLPVTAALVHNNEWDLYEDKVSWLSTSAIPGEGNVILYAHNTIEMFGNLYLLKKGDIIDIQQNEIWIPYVVTESRNITPDDIESILSDKNQLTLYTCEGSFDQKRRVIYAEPL